MSLLGVRLFGKFSTQPNGPMQEGLDVPKVQELFCYLLLHRDRPHPREALASLLWGDISTTQSKRYLRKALWRLQKALNTSTKPPTPPVLQVDSDWVQLNPAAELWLDVTVFEAAFDRVQGVPGRELDLQDVQTLQDALELYQGNLLEGWYQDWCLYERERLQHMYLAMLDRMMDYCEAQHSYEAGLAYGLQILRYEPARERTYRCLMRLHHLAGDRTAALRQYARCVAALDEELGVEPAKHTLALYEQIRADQLLVSPSPAPTEATMAPQRPASLPDILVHLHQLQALLTSIQSQVEQEIKAVELYLSGRH